MNITDLDTLDSIPPPAGPLDPDALYHLATADQWAAYQATGVIEPEAFAEEGFVHCSWGRQVPGTVAKHFPGVTGLLALKLDPPALGDVPLKDEDLYDSGQTFPHAYAPIPVDAVSQTIPVA